jgi:hypothetical protein
MNKALDVRLGGLHSLSYQCVKDANSILSCFCITRITAILNITLGGGIKVNGTQTDLWKICEIFL